MGAKGTALSGVEDVKGGLRSRLPAFMIPQLFLPLSQIPTTITGKADRRSLSHYVNKLSYAQLNALTTQEERTRAAQDKVEDAIHSAVCDVLGLAPRRFGMLDNFFHLGGNSASAMRLTMSLKRRGLRLTIRDVFDYPVLAELASAASLSNGCEGPEVRTMQLLEPGSVSELKQLAVSQCRIDEDVVEDIYPPTALQEGLIAMTARDPSLYKARCKLPRNRFSAFIRYLSNRKPGFKEYWIRQFQGLEAVTFPPLPSPSYTPVASEQLEYVVSLFEKSHPRITTASYIKLAWAVVLSCNTGVNDTVFGMTVNGRGAAVDAVGEMTGPTIATIPQRIKLLPEQTVMGTLVEIQAHSLDVIPYEQAGLLNIQKYSHEARSAYGDLSYAELMQSANNLAAQLVTRGVKPGSFIPMFFEKCKWSPVAMLGILKAGAAFVLLDPTYPLQRLHAICDGLRSEIVLCSKNMRERAASLTSSAIAIHDHAECLANVASATLPVRLAVTHAFLTPSAARLLMHRELPSLRVLVMGGEAMSPADCSYWMKRVRLMNEYGLAECAVASTIREVLDVDQRNIGFPMGVATWIVDQNDHRNLVAIGAIGELLIEGPCVGRGYLDNPEANRRAFIDQPDWLRSVRHGNPSRVYKTGDLVQYNEDGSLNFVGRKDSQIKIRGQRFELEEVEHHLRRIDQIESATAVVAAPSDRQQQSYLIAFVVPSRRETFCVHSTNGLITHPTEEFCRLATSVQSKLHSILPTYMVPSIYLPVTQLPKTSSDKVDRCRLKTEVRKMTWSRLQVYSVSSTPHRAPFTGVEQYLQQVWAQTLGVPLNSIGVEHSFFHLGGDSITAMQVVTEARSRGLGHTIQDIMELKTIEAIAKKIGALPSIIAQPAVQDEVTNELFGLTPIQEYFFEKYPDGTHRFNQNILVHLQKQVAERDVERAATMLVRNHAMLRARYARQEDGSWKQRIERYSDQCFRFKAHKVNSVEEIRRIIGQSQRSMDLERGPVFTVDLFNRHGHQSLFIIGHHLVLDLVSWRIILSDLEATILDTQHQPQLTMPFQTWARLQAEYGARHLEPIPISQVYSIDEPFMRKFWGAENNANAWCDSKTTLIRLSEQMTNMLFGPCIQALDVEPVELLHAAILFSFVRTFPQRPAPFIFGKGHGRESWDSSIDVTRTIGWFNTMWPVVAQVSPSENFETTLHTVRQAIRAMDMHGWKYFTSIYHNTKRERCRAGVCPVEITFNYAGRRFQQIECDGSLFRMEPMAQQSLFDGADELGRWAMVEVNSIILNGMLEFHVSYNRGTDEDHVLTPWMDSLFKCLEDLASGFV
ncbi:hypothetical protein ATERTT37_006716 [Aspergillus terreus]